MNCSKKNCSSPSSNKYIPPELLIQIFAKLPVKSLLRFRCVSKSWYSTIYNPNFVSMHLKLYNNQSNSGKLLALERLGLFRGGILRLREAETCRNIADIFKISEKYDLIGTCGSLILINPSKNFMYTKDMKLCNPSIRKSLLVPPPLLPINGYWLTVVLGFATRSEDYKIIAIAAKPPKGNVGPEMRLLVYTLSDPQWVLRDNGLNIISLSFDNLFGPFYFWEGASHCLGKYPYSNHFGEPTHLVSLDFDSENFTFLELPSQSGEIDITSRALFLLGNSLAFFCISPDSFRIWLLKQESGMREWTLWFLGRSSNDVIAMFDHMGSKTQRVVYYQGDGGYLIYGKKSYNIFTCQVRKLGKTIRNEVDLAAYSESLVLCNTDGAEDVM